MKINIAFDLSIFIYANFHIHKNIEGGLEPERFSKSVLKQIQGILKDLQKSYKIGEYVICADSNNFRRDFYPEYKAQRVENTEVENLKEFVIDYVRDSGNFVLREMGLESDDLLFLYCLKRTQEGTPCMIVSNDNDCKLMLLEGSSFYKYKSKQVIDYNENDQKLHRFKKVLLGDSGDNIPRILRKGLGEVWVEKFYNNHTPGPLSTYYKSLQNLEGLDLELVKRNIILTNYSLKIYEQFVENFTQKFERI